MVDNNTVEYSKALKEVYVIINSYEYEIYAKIPLKFIKMIKENMAKDYHINIKYFDDHEMLPETEAILSLIYRDYLVDEDEKIRLKAEDAKYIDELFKVKFDTPAIEEKVEETTQELVVVQESKIQKIINFIKKLLKKY